MQGEMKQISKMPGVLTVEADTKISASQAPIETCDSQDTPPILWGLDRIDQVDLPLDGFYRYNQNDGSGVLMYFLDSGIQADHPDFNNRVTYGNTFCSACEPGIDGFRHGTPVAGIAISSSYGVAKNATAVDVQVLDSNGDGSTSDVIMAIEWAVNDRKARRSPPSIITMSFGGPLSIALNTAVGHAKDEGFVIVASATNENTDACFSSPGSAPSAITVGCFDVRDAYCSFSQVGSCINILAPGVNIASLSPNNTITLETGNSFAAPFVSGLIARYLSGNPSATPHQSEDWLQETGVDGRVLSVPRGTCNKMAHYPACFDEYDDYGTDTSRRNTNRGIRRRERTNTGGVHASIQRG